MKAFIFIGVLFFSNAKTYSALKPSKVFLTQKSFDWLRENQTFSQLPHYQRDWVTYEGEEFFFKVLEVFETILPIQRGSYSAYSMALEKLIGQLHAPSSTLIDAFKKRINLVSDQNTKNYLLKLLESGSSSKKVQLEPLSKKTEMHIGKVFNLLKEFISKIPGNSRLEQKLKLATDILKNLLVGEITDEDCYQDDPGCQFGSNRGIIKYFAKRLLKDHELYLATLKVGVLIENLNNATSPPNPQPETKSEINLWPQIVQLVGDSKLALLAITVFGHDVCCNGLYGELDQNGTLEVLNLYSYAKYGGDWNPGSWLFVPGVLNGTNVPKSVLNHFLKAKNLYDQQFNNGSRSDFRAGYHHVIGGILTATLLYEQNISRAFNLNLGTLTSQSLGFVYKYTQTMNYLSEDAQNLWKQVHYSQNLSSLWKPHGWDSIRYQKAKIELNYNLAIIEYTEYQHRAGAKFAYKIFKEN